MVETPEIPQKPPAESKFPPILRAIGIGALVLILWSVEKLAVSRLPQGSVWRYIISGVIISVGLATVISFIGRLNLKNT
jgi:hypothetical protein